MSGQREVQAALTEQSLAGYWRVVAYPYGKAARDVTITRGMPITVGELSFADPFGAQALTLNVPSVTIFDQRGVGDLDWMVKHVDVDVIWTGTLPDGYPFGITTTAGFVPQWRWEGYITSFSWDSGGTTIQIKGAGLQLDNFIAKPEYLARPMPYEWAIARQFQDKLSLRLQPLRVVWPDWWTQTYVPPPPFSPPYLVPSGVSKGQKWSGLLTRSTGQWDPVLTSYIASLLSAMYSERGRWTLDFLKGRQPVLFHRDFSTSPGASTVQLDPADPGVKISLTEDWEQALTTVYGQGTALNGVAYTGMQISADGQITRYKPLAAARQVYPTKVDNGWLDESVMEKEVLVQMQAGLSADDAAIVARAHLTRFAHPGVTGQVTLDSDPLINGQRIPRHLIRAGMELHVPHLFGRPEGVMLHVSASSSNLASGKTTLTVDSKYRDALTVEEVRLRGRDSLAVSRMLIAGQYQPPVPDQLFPWSYAEGSGYLPSNAAFNAVPLFAGMPDDLEFPWTQWTTQRPPKDARWRNCYLRLGPTKPNADLNWITQHSESGDGVGVPIRMAQAGQIRMVQIAAYDLNGNVLKVPFHVSFYTVGGVNPQSMPMIPAEQASMFAPYLPGQHYPFVRDGFEAYQIDGTRTNPNIPHPTESVGLVRAYGTFYEKAGYWPGQYSSGDAATGLLVDEGQWSFDLSEAPSGIDPYKPEGNQTSAKAGQLYAMIYCDAQATQEVFFVGRIWRVEPGSGV